MRHGWKGKSGMVHQPDFCRRKNRINKILVMNFIPVIWFVSGITNAAQPGFRVNSGGFCFARQIINNPNQFCRWYQL